MHEFNGLLVPVDFSAAAKAAFDHALSLVSGEGATIILLHVMDTSLIEFATVNELAAHEEVVDAMRARAELALADYRAPDGADVDVVNIVVEGVPFLEIIKKADELHVDAVVMGKFGVRGRIEPYLFGTTAERVVRGSTRPVIVLPAGA
jgi:nucleotide-binding universal stress UspA family protein